MARQIRRKRVRPAARPSRAVPDKRRSRVQDETQRNDPLPVSEEGARPESVIHHAREADGVASVLSRGGGAGAFLLHLLPRQVRRRTASAGATLGLGLATLVSLALVTVSGILLLFFYVPSVERAHGSVQDIISVVPFGRMVRNLHRFGAHAVVLFCFLHLLRTLLWGSYRKTHARVWLAGVGLLVLTLATSFSGYLLPWDQDAYWTVTVATSLVGQVPLAGEAACLLLLGGSEVGQPALTRFFVLHVIALPGLGLLLLVVHLFRLRRAGGLARPPDAGGPAEELVPASPLLTGRLILLASTVTLLLLLLAVLVQAQLGPAPDISRPDNPPKAPWFLVGVQEMVSYSVLVGGVILPGVLLALLALLPWLERRSECDGALLPGARRRLAVASGALLCALVSLASVIWWGDPQQGSASWANPATLAAATALGVLAALWILTRDRSLALQALASGLLVELLAFTAVGWLWRGPDWTLTFHPGPGHAEVAAPVRATRKGGETPATAPAEIIQVTTVSGAVDRCATCHRQALAAGRGSEKREGGKAKDRPRSTHPLIPGHADLRAMGCTPCHGGQGRRLDMAGAHRPLLGEGPDPFLRPPFIEARCARCHLPTSLAGAPGLDRGFTEYLEAGCTGCHQPGRDEEGLGPDLRRLERRSEKELKEALLQPAEGHAQAVMWSLRWRYDPQTEAGRKLLGSLVTALLAISDSPEPFRRAWARPGLQWDVDCASCHRAPAGDGSEAGEGPAGPRHRCTLLLQRRALRCRLCHGDSARGGWPAGDGRACPQVRAARDLCPVCHLR